MNESQIRTKFRKFLKGVVFVDKNNYKREIPIELTEDWIIEQFQQYKAELLREIEGMKKRIISEVRQKAYDEGFEKGRAHGYEVASYERHWE